MKLNPAILLWMHDQYSSASAVPEVIGDAYLIRHNFSFKQTRDALKREGYRFISDGSELSKCYAAAPLLMLNELLIQKAIPYRSNLIPLRNLERRCPHIAIEGGMLLPLFGRNVLFHESLHCIAALRVDAVLDRAGIDNPAYRFVMGAALVEAFANAVERLAFHEADAPLHLLFLRMNSYIEFDVETCRLLKDLVSHFGLRKVFRMAICTLCVLNLRASAPSFKDVAFIGERGADNNKLGTAELRLWTESCRKLWGLSKTFRDQTSKFFYEMHGYGKEYNSLLQQATFAPPCTFRVMQCWADAMFEYLFT